MRAALTAVIDALEPIYLANLLIAMDAHFIHRLRGAEGKDGNPLNEVRMLCYSMINSDNVLQADKTIKEPLHKSFLESIPRNPCGLPRGPDTFHRTLSNRGQYRAESVLGFRNPMTGQIMDCTRVFDNAREQIEYPSLPSPQ